MHRTILALEEQRDILARERDNLAMQQRALLQGFCWARGLGEFDPQEWTVTKDGELVRAETTPPPED